ncbi:hypothetical protein MPSEU_000221100 [Mayamaea pseudoterrestris]|nr:hypothetical protein MPSEU_000221100 [Mayamaea pseudoterrestris]
MHTNMIKSSLSSNKRPLHIETPSTKRRKVSFAEAPLSVHSNDCSCSESSSSWITKQSIIDTVQTHPVTIQQTYSKDPSAYHLHCELLAATYTSSVLQGDAAFASNLHSAQQHYSTVDSCSHLLALSGMSHLRGLEAFVLSSVASDRMQRRRRHQCTMIKAHARLSKHNDDERSSLMRKLSERLSASSKSFARAMGAADALSAMVEHASEMQCGSVNNMNTAVLATTPADHHHHHHLPMNARKHSLPSADKRRCMLPFKVVSPVA